jgi:phosphohistidine phosphatase SixA
MQRLFIGRHGRDNYETGGLLPEGEADAQDMAKRLREFGVGRGVILLSSDRLRTVQTAEIIKRELAAPTIVRSPFIRKAGNNPQPVLNLWSFTGKVLEACGVDHAEADVMMVTHMPLVQAAAGQPLQYGGVYEVPESWQNPRFIPRLEKLIDNPENW